MNRYQPIATFRNLFLILLSSLLFPGLLFCQNNAVVEINAFLPSGGVKQGTGFFFRDDASILTAYHVIQDAKKISVMVQNETGIYSDVIVEFISPKYDIAMIYLPELEKSIGSVPLASSNYIPPLSETLKAIGYPRMGAQHNIRTHLTTSNFISSKTIFDSRGNQIFNEDIEILPIALINYSGMSGAPIISNNGVIGIFSGSYDEGGALGWVIPCKYFGSVQKIHKRPEEITSWKPLALMGSSFKDLRRSIELTPYTSTLVQSYLNNIEKLSNNYNQLTEVSAKLLGLGEVLLIGAESTESLSALMEPLSDQLLNNLGIFEKACFAHDEINISLNRSLADIINWTSSESNLNVSQKNKAFSRIDKISTEYADVTEIDFFTKIGVNDKTMRETVSASAKMANAQTIEELQVAIIDLSKALKNYMGPFQSSTAYMYSSRDIFKHRAYAKLFMETVSNLENTPDKIIEDVSKNWTLLDKKEFSINYPDYWLINESGHGGSIFILHPKLYVGKDNLKANLNLIIDDLAWYYSNVDQYAEGAIPLIPNYYENSNIIRFDKSTNNSIGYARLIFSGDYESHNMVWEQYYFSKSGKVYILTFACQKNQFEIYRETAEKIMESFRFK